MLEKEETGFTGYCDNCSEYHETGEDNFFNAVEEIKRQGWRIKKKGPNWEHTCPSCVSDGVHFHD